MAGPGIRYWEMAHALQRRGHCVSVLTRRLEKAFPRCELSYLGTSSLCNLIVQIVKSDRIIQPGSPLSLLLSVLFRKKLIFDLYDPVIFEFIERRVESLKEKLYNRVMLLLWKVRQRLLLRFGDEFLVANEKQKDLLIGQLSVLGYYRKMNSVVLMPFGLSATPPARSHAVLRGTKIKESDFLLVWGGGIWDWFDPSTLLIALAKLSRTRNDIKAYFPGILPPNPRSRRMAVTRAFFDEASELGLLDNTVFVNQEWTSYERRADYLLEADAGISLHRESLETRFAFRTRMLDYLWAGLPVIASKGDSWAEVIENQGVGITVPCGEVEALAVAIERMADDVLFREQCRKQSRAVAFDYVWDVLVERVEHIV